MAKHTINKFEHPIIFQYLKYRRDVVGGDNENLDTILHFFSGAVAFYRIHQAIADTPDTPEQAEKDMELFSAAMRDCEFVIDLVQTKSLEDFYPRLGELVR